jgi:hypothetical protein
MISRFIDAGTSAARNCGCISHADVRLVGDARLPKMLFEAMYGGRLGNAVVDITIPCDSEQPVHSGCHRLRNVAYMIVFWQCWGI